MFSCYALDTGHVSPWCPWHLGGTAIDTSLQNFRRASLLNHVEAIAAPVKPQGVSWLN